MDDEMDDIDLGDMVKDKASEYFGVVTGIAFYLYSEPSVQVDSGKVGTDGKPISNWFSMGRVELMTKVQVKE